MNSPTHEEIAAKAYEIYMARFDTDEGHELEDFLTDKQLYELSVQDWLNAEATLNN